MYNCNSPGRSHKSLYGCRSHDFEIGPGWLSTVWNNADLLVVAMFVPGPVHSNLNREIIDLNNRSKGSCQLSPGPRISNGIVVMVHYHCVRRMWVVSLTSTPHKGTSINENDFDSSSIAPVSRNT